MKIPDSILEKLTAEEEQALERLIRWSYEDGYSDGDQDGFERGYENAAEDYY